MKKLLLFGWLLCLGATMSHAAERTDDGSFTASSMFAPEQATVDTSINSTLTIGNDRFSRSSVISASTPPRFALAPGAYASAEAASIDGYLGERYIMGHVTSSNTLAISKTTVTKTDDTHVLFNGFFYTDVNISASVDMTAGTFSIPAGQQVAEIEGTGKIYMCRMDFDNSTYSSTDPICGKLYDGAFHIEDGYGFFVTEGPQAGAYLNIGLMEYTAIATPNATMTNQVITYGGDGTMTQANQQLTSKANLCYAYPVSTDRLRVMNLLVRETSSSTTYSDILINLGTDRTASIDPQPVSTLMPFGDFCIYNMTENADASGKITYSVSQITPISVTYNATNKRMSWGTWAVANPSAGVLSATRSSTLTFDTEPVFPQPLTVSFEGEGTQDSPWLIKTATDMAALSQMVMTDTSVRGNVMTDGDSRYYNVLTGKYFRIAADIDMSTLTSTFKPIGNTTFRFNGIIDGDGHTVANLRFSDYAYDYCALIGVLSVNGKVSHLTVNRPRIESLGYNAAAVVARNYGVLDSVTVTSPTIYATKGYNTGGIVSYNYGTISNCTVSDLYISSLGFSGGIAGRCISGVIDHCHASGRILITGAQVYGGGISGYNTKYTTDSAGSVISDCSFSGSVSATGDQIAIGGIAGAMAYSKIERCFANAVLANASATSSFMGGIVGSVGESSITDCYVSGWVRNSETTNAGGLAGHSSEYSNPVGTTFTNCYASVMLDTKSTDTVKGLAGNVVNFTFNNCYYDSQIAATNDETYGRTTAQMTTASGLPGFSADVWVFADGLYPRLKGMEDSDAAAVSASPLTLAESDIVSRVEHDFLYGSAPDVQWRGIINGTFTPEGGYAYSFDNGTGRLNYNQHTDTIFVSRNNVSKYYITNIVPVLFKGSGTAEQPWLISSTDDLKKLAEITNQATMPFEGKHFALTADLDFGGDELTPICKDHSGKLAFAGTFDGGGHTIDNYVITAVAFYTEGANAGKVNPKDDKSYYYSGLFGNIGADGTVKNLNIGAKARTDGFSYTGAIAGSNTGTVSNCHNLSAVTAYFGYAGGIVGALKAGGSIRDCYNGGSVRANGNTAGGIAANAESAVIENCENTGKVSAYWFNAYQKEGSQYLAGGIVGQNNYSSLLNVVNSGDVSSYKQVGGIAGKVTATAAKPATVTNAVNYGLVYAWNDLTSCGQIAGLNTLGKYANCYADHQLQRCGFVANGAMDGVSGVNTAMLASEKVSLPDSAWTLTAGAYPTMKYDVMPAQVALNSKAVILFAENNCASAMLANATLAKDIKWTLTGNTDAFAIDGETLTVKIPAKGTVTTDTIVASLDNVQRKLPVSSLDIYILNGSGTVQDPFLVNTATDFMTVANMVNDTQFDYDGYCFKVTADLDFKDMAFSPIADNGILFNGTFDGNGKNLKNITCTGDEKTDLYHGAFGTIGYNGTVKNLDVDASCTFSAYTYAGGIAGALYGTISNCRNHGSVSTTGTTNAGGIAGIAYTGSAIDGCTNTGTVQAKTTMAGGILGGSSADARVDIAKCHNEGTVSGTQKTGGIAGSASAFISDCTNTGTVAATTSYAGGILGEALLPSGIARATNRAAVTTPQYMGGIVATSVAHTKASPFVIESCVNEADLTIGAKGYSGGLGGSLKAGVQVLDCHNSGDIAIADKSTAIRVAGLFGDITSTLAAPSSIEKSYNTGNITGYTQVAGLCSYFTNAQNDGAWMRDCYNTGNITGLGTAAAANVGGLLGNGGSVIIEDCWNSGDITSNGGYVGGLVGQKNSYITSFARNFNSGAVTGKNSGVGGFIGYGRVGMTDCCNFGTVTGTTNVAGFLGYTGPVGATLYTLHFNNSYNTGKLTATAANGITGNVCVLNTGTKYCEVDNCYFNSDVNDVTAQDTQLGNITGLSTAALCDLKIDDAFETATATYPMLKKHAGNEAMTFAVAQVLLAEGESLSAVSSSFKVGTPEGAVWTATDNLAISGNTVTPKPSQAGEKASLTLTVGKFTRTYEMTLTGMTTGVDTISGNGKTVASTRYYTTDGREVAAPLTGSVIIERITYTDGTTAVNKYVVNN